MAPRQAQREVRADARAYLAPLVTGGVSLVSRVPLALDVRGLRRLLSALRHTPTLLVDEPDTDCGAWLRSYLRPRRGRRSGTRSAQLVLTLPETMEDYLRGRSRQAVRTNVTKARALGLTVRPARADERPSALAVVGGTLSCSQDILARDTRTDGPLPGDEWYVAVDADDNVVAVATMAVGARWAVLRYLVAVKEDPVRSPGRYLLHTELVRILIERGVRHLVVDRVAFALPAGVWYFQERLGYGIAHLRVDGAVATRASRRSAAVSNPQLAPAAEGLPRG